MNISGDNHTVTAVGIWVGIIIFIIVLLSVVGNGMILLVFYCCRSKMVGLEVLCVSLALSDFLCCILFYPLSIYSSFHHIWLGGSTSCTYYGFGCNFFALCSKLTVTAISLVRYLKICRSSVSTAWLKGANVQICCFIWLVAMVWSSLPLLGWGEYAPEPYGLSCAVAWRGYHSSAKDAFYVVCSFGLFTLIPFLLIVVSQCRIIFTVCRLSRQISDESIRNKLKHTEKKLSWVFFFISLGFVFAWFPYTIVSFLLIFKKDQQYMAPEGFVALYLFAKSSHIYNPIMYFYLNKNFQKILCHLHCNFWVGQKETEGDVGVREGEGNPGPVDINLQNQSRTQKKKKSVFQHKSNHSNGSEDRPEEGSGSHQGIKPVPPCWDFTLDHDTGVVLEKEPAQVSTSTQK